ncbi:hypothetical protein AMECASPLE_037244 [Ameca splendens]|uniref:Uncharacterized protein n=1 Tax=Ameca splendens TaxID=208324 RepID=A0ABV1AFH6_9TELE
MVLFSYGTYINSCFEWESSQRSITAFILFVVVVWNFELYMLPLGLVLLLVWNYFFSSSREVAETSMEAMFEWEDEEEDKEEKVLSCAIHMHSMNLDFPPPRAHVV